MKFDRRRFFQSLTASAALPAVVQGHKLATEMRAEVPLAPDERVPFPLRIADRRPFLLFDTLAQRAGEPAQTCNCLFQIPVGQYDQNGQLRTRRDTNMLMCGSLPAGWDAVVDRLGFLFHPDTCDEDMIAASRWGRYEFVRGNKIVERGALDWTASGGQRGNALAREAKFIDILRTFIPGQQYFQLVVYFDQPVVWKSDLRMLCFLDSLTDFPVQ